MTQQLYYQLQAKLQLMDTLSTQFFTALDDARDLFSQIDPNLLGGVGIPMAATPPPPVTTGTSTTFPPPPISPPAQAPAKPRVRLNAPVLHGAIKDAVEDAIAYKQAALDEAAKPKRIAPYEVLVTEVKYRDLYNDYWADVLDKKHNETTMVPIDQGTFDEFNRDPDGLLIELDSKTLETAEWFPGKEPTTDSATSATTETVS